MAADITLLGATYNDVPAVTLPRSGSGTATFVEMTELANAGTATPLADSGNGSVGMSTSYAREDHVHPEPNYGNIVSFSVVEVTT